MFVKFTKKDGSPVWINANFVVTVESVKGGGSIVVPVGDGLDYEVREGVDKVLASVESARGAVAVVPVTSTDALASAAEGVVPGGVVEGAKGTFDVVSDANGPAAEKPASEESAAEEPAAEQPSFESPAGGEDLSEEASAAGVAAAMAFSEMQQKAKEAESKPKRTRKAKPAAPGTPATEGERKTPARRRSVRKTPLELSDEQVERLRKMSPRSVRKLTNSLKEKQFAVEDAEKTIKALVEHGIITVDDQTQHVEWIAPENA